MLSSKAIDSLKEAPENRRVLLLNPFLDQCVEPTQGNEENANGHLFAGTPLGLVYVYTYARKNLPDVDFKIIDGQVMLMKNAEKGMEQNWRLLLDEIVSYDPQIIGISACYYKSAYLFHETCNQIKKILPGVVIIGGGNYPTDGKEAVLEDTDVDFVVMSEGEAPFTALVDCLYGGGDPNDVGGVGFKDENGDLVFTEERYNSHFLPPEELMIPDRSTLPMDFYGKGRNVIDRLGMGGYRSLEMTVSRGCPYKCTFCNAKGFWGQRIRYRDAQSALDEMEILKNEYGANVILINDDNFLLNKKKVSEIAKGIIERKLDIKWLANGGSNVRALCDESFLDLVVESGFLYFNLAIESGSQKTLDRIKKPTRVDEIWTLVELIRKNYPHMWLNGYFIVGFPFETRQEIIDTHQFSIDLKLDWCTYSLFKPFPNTELYDECVAMGLIKNFDWNCGSNHEPTVIDGPDWDRTWLYETNYENNLRSNFLKNVNLQRGETDPYAFEQALRDFEYVISITSNNHALGYRQAAFVADKLRLKEKAETYRAEEARVLAGDESFVKWYKRLGLPVDATAHNLQQASLS